MSKRSTLISRSSSTPEEGPSCSFYYVECRYIFFSLLLYAIKDIKLIKTYCISYHEPLIKTTKLSRIRLIKVSVSDSANGPWTEVLSDSLPDSSNLDPVPLSKFNIQRVSARFVRFKLLSYWGVGGGLQYFHASESSTCQQGLDFYFLDLLSMLLQVQVVSRTFNIMLDFGWRKWNGIP